MHIPPLETTAKKHSMVEHRSAGFDPEKAFPLIDWTEEALVAVRRRPETEEGAASLVRTLLQGQADCPTRRLEGNVHSLPIKGDDAARNAFFTFLQPEQQRKLFRQFVQEERRLPLVRHLFGAPPFSFLTMEEGASAFRVAGVAHRRKNLGLNAAQLPSICQFGKAHLVDALGRRYRVHDVKPDADTQGHHKMAGPYRLLEMDGKTESLLVLHPRLGEGRRPLFVGDTIRLQQPPASRRLWRMEEPLRLVAEVVGCAGSEAHPRVGILSVRCMVE